MQAVGQAAGRGGQAAGQLPVRYARQSSGVMDGTARLAAQSSVSMGLTAAQNSSSTLKYKSTGTSKKPTGSYISPYSQRAHMIQEQTAR